MSFTLCNVEKETTLFCVDSADSIVIRSISVVWNHSVVILITMFFSRSDLILGTLQVFRYLSAASSAVYRQFFRNFSEEIPGTYIVRPRRSCVGFYEFSPSTRRYIQQRSKREPQTCVRLTRFHSH